MISFVHGSSVAGAADFRLRRARSRMRLGRFGGRGHGPSRHCFPGAQLSAAGGIGMVRRDRRQRTAPSACGFRTRGGCQHELAGMGRRLLAHLFRGQVQGRVPDRNQCPGDVHILQEPGAIDRQSGQLLDGRLRPHASRPVAHRELRAGLIVSTGPWAMGYPAEHDPRGPASPFNGRVVVKVVRAGGPELRDCQGPSEGRLADVDCLRLRARGEKPPTADVPTDCVP